METNFKKKLITWYAITAILLLASLAPGIREDIATMFTSLAIMSCTGWTFYLIVLESNMKNNKQ